MLVDGFVDVGVSLVRSLGSRFRVLRRYQEFDAKMQGALAFLTGIKSSKTVKEHACTVKSNEILYEVSMKLPSVDFVAAVVAIAYTILCSLTTYYYC